MPSIKFKDNLKQHLSAYSCFKMYKSRAYCSNNVCRENLIWLNQYLYQLFFSLYTKLFLDSNKLYLDKILAYSHFNSI